MQSDAAVLRRLSALRGWLSAGRRRRRRLEESADKTVVNFLIETANVAALEAVLAAVKKVDPLKLSKSVETLAAAGGATIKAEVTAVAATEVTDPSRFMVSVEVQALSKEEAATGATKLAGAASGVVMMTHQADLVTIFKTWAMRLNPKTALAKATKLACQTSVVEKNSTALVAADQPLP